MEKAKDPQNGSICHVEFSAPDLAKAQKLYGDLFGWQFFPMKPDEYYFQTPGNWGPCGCVLKGKAGDTQTTIYVNVTDIPATLAKATKLGATVSTPRTEIPGGHGFLAKIGMPDGNTFGLYSRS
jgi:predicted enzyme related to lactoylglutathione lyase